MKSTFTLKGRHAKKKYPNGTKPSVHNGQLLISTGLNDLDGILGGGVPLGSVILLKEDAHSHYSQYLTRYFVSEGIHSAHAVCVCHDPSLPRQSYPSDGAAVVPKSPVLASLPFVYLETQAPAERKPKLKPLTTEPPKPAPEDKSGLRVAWRYQKMVEESKERKQSTQRGHGTVGCHTYDISKGLHPDVVKRLEEEEGIVGKRLTEIDAMRLWEEHGESMWTQLYAQIRCSVEQSLSVLHEESDQKVLRIAIQSLGSLAYGDSSMNGRSILQFITALRGLVRSSLCVAMITVSKHTLPSDLLRKMEHAADVVLNMDSFVGAGMDVSEYEFKEYTGLFHIEKLPRFNSMTLTFAPDTLHYAFKMHRRKMTIETMHLPPEESRTASESDRERSKYQSSAQAEALSSGCGTGGSSNKLDF